jgi:hypothetical protein
MPCEVSVDTAIKAAILDCNDTALEQIRTFLYELQDDPLPLNRQPLGDAAFYVHLPCGYFVSWEIEGDLLKMALKQDLRGITVRILGVGKSKPTK